MFRLNQKGVSLPLVLGLMAIIIANTYYFMEVDKSTVDQNIKRGSEIDDNTEKIRLGTFLSDANVCTENFGGKTLATINAASPKKLVKNAIIFLEAYDAAAVLPALPASYSRGSLRFESYVIQVDALNPVTAEKMNSLFITYAIVDRKTNTITTKKKIIRIPLNISFDASSNIATCYADPDKDLSTVDNVVTAACQGNAATLISTGLPECQHNLIIPTCSNGMVLKGVVSNGGAQEYTCGAVTGAGAGAIPVPCTATPIQTLVKGIANNNTLLCATPDPSCAAGQILVMSTGDAPVCGATCGAGFLFQRISATGAPTCVQRPSPCGPGQYTKEIQPDGDSICADYTVINKDCGAGKFATDIDPTTSVTNSALGCTAYSKAKTTCQAGAYTFVHSFAAGATPTCITYSN